jgi:phosphatidylglycerol:prolipoprotein diacylglycerol transferase
MTHPLFVDIDPVAFHIFSFGVRWYGLMYLGGFIAGLGLGEYRRRRGYLSVDRDAFLDLAFYVMLGIIVGGRVWYMLTYQPINWVWTDPLRLFQVWDGGMSFHGGLLGVVIASLWWWWRHRATVKHYFDVVDYVAPMIPIGLGLGRIGNFINGELWGKLSNLPWAMIYPHALQDNPRFAGMTVAQLHALYPTGVLDQYARQPSELYEFFLEGVVLFVVLWIFSSKPRRRYAVSGWFALLYGVFRCCIGFIREPDIQIGYLFHTGWVTMGQVQSAPLIILGLVLLWLSRRAPVVVPRRGERLDAGAATSRA